MEDVDGTTGINESAGRKNGSSVHMSMIWINFSVDRLVLHKVCEEMSRPKPFNFELASICRFHYFKAEMVTLNILVFMSLRDWLPGGRFSYLLSSANFSSFEITASWPRPKEVFLRPKPGEGLLGEGLAVDAIAQSNRDWILNF